MKDERRNGITDIRYSVYIIHHIHRPYIDARSKEYQQSQTKQNGGYSVTICFHERSPVCQMSSKVSSIFCISETMV